jgi:hypothetical protein
MDDVKGKPFISWSPNNKVFNKIWKVHQEFYEKDLWIEACPGKKDFIEHKYLRIAGVFVPYSKPRSNVKDKRHWEGKPSKPSGVKVKKAPKRGKMLKRGRK